MERETREAAGADASDSRPPALRPAVPSDTDLLLRFWRDTAYGSSISDDEVSVARLLAHPTSRCLIIEHQRQIVASLIVGWDGWRISLYRLAVAAGCRRLGLATQLVQEAANYAGELGARRVDAMVDRGNASAGEFWIAAGYSPNESYARYEKTIEM